MNETDMGKESARDSAPSMKVSVIVPVYNIEDCIDRCVQSIVTQTYENLEVVLVDDGSTDSSGAVCDEWSARDSRVTVVHKTNGGLSSARNAGIDVASGELLAFVDGDDYVDSDMISDMVLRMNETGADLVVTGFRWVDEKGAVIRESCPRDSVIEENDFWKQMCGLTSDGSYLLNATLTVAWNKLYHCKIFDSERYDVGRVHEDEFIIHRIVNQCGSIATIGRSYYNYVQRDGSIMHSESAASILDAVEAFILRADYLAAKGYDDACTATLSAAMRHLARSRSDAEDGEDLARLKEYEEGVRRRIRGKRLRGQPMKSRLRVRAFCLSPALYYATRGVRK